MLLFFTILQYIHSFYILNSNKSGEDLNSKISVLEGMHGLISRVMRKAKGNPQRIVFPESQDQRVLEAAKKIVKKKIARVILLGNPRTLSLKLGKAASHIEIVDIKKSKDRMRYVEEMYKLRKSKGWSLETCKKKIADAVYFGTMMVHCGDADGMVCGATHTTTETLRPALQIIKTKELYHKVSGRQGIGACFFWKRGKITRIKNSNLCAAN